MVDVIIIHMCADETHTIFWGVSHLIPFDGFNDTVRLLLKGTEKSGIYFFVVDGIGELFEQVINNRRS